MATAAPTAMSTGTAPMRDDAQLLTLAQWLSPAYPVGGFAYSHGLESAVRAGWIADAGGLETWLEDVLEHGSGRADAIWLHLAHRCADGDDLMALDDEARAFAPTRERLREGARQGAAFARTTGEVWGLDLPDLLLPLALGRAARLMGMAPGPVAALYLHAFAGNLVAAAQRLMPMGQTAAQRVLAGLTPLCAAVAEATATADLDDIASTAFLSDVAAMTHETLEPRIFQS